MTSNVLQFDFEEMARLAREAPEDFPHKREALIRQLINKAPRTEQQTELQKMLNQACYQFVVPSMQLRFHIAHLMLWSASFMVAYMLMQQNQLIEETSRSAGNSGRSHELTFVQ